MQIGLKLGIPMLTGGGTVPTAAIIAMFGGGEQGGIYDLNNLGTVFQERSSPTTPSGNGDPIGTLLDLSPNANHMVAPSDAGRPLLELSGGFWRAVPDQIDDYLSTPISITGATLYAACAFNTRTAVGESYGRVIAFGNGSDDTSNNACIPITRRNGLSTFTALRGGVETIVSPSANTDVVMEAGFSGTGTYVGLNAGTDVTTVQAYGNFGTTLFRMFAAARPVPNANEYSKSYLYRAMTINRLPTAGERTTIRAWLAQGAGIAL